MSIKEDPAFIDSPAIKGREERYVTLDVDTAKVLDSWKNSLYAFEWLTEEGLIRERDSLPEQDRTKYAAVESCLKTGEALEKPVLGIGMMDNIEIGAGRAVFLTLTAKGLERLPVHVPKSHRDDFAAFLA